LSDSKRKPFLLRVSDALRALSSGEEARAIIPTTYPNFGAGTQQMQLVRTADPTEYRRDGRTVRVQGFNAHPVVHACMRVIADIVASVPLVVLKEKGDFESRVGADHPLQKLLDYPGPRFTARQFRARFAVDFLGYGNAFFTMNRTSPNRAPFGLSPVNPESIQQVWIDTEGDPRRYDYANWAGIIVNVPVEDMLHFRDLEMGRPFEADVFGYPRGATAIGSLLADNEATQYVRQVVTNDGTPTFAVLMADEASTEDAVAMQDRYTARVVDRGKRGVPAFFGAVKDIKPLGFTLSDLEFPDLRRVSREDICAAFGVDPRMVGIASASSDGGLSGIQYAEARARLVQHTIEPLFSAFEDELNHWLAPEFGDVWVTYDHDILRDLVENDTETSTRIRAEFQSSLRTWEESRRALKLSPIPEPTDTLLKPMGGELVPAAIAVIDPRDIADQPPATDNETPDIAPDAINATGPTAVSADVQGQALNGAQVTSLIDMLTQLAANQLPADTVEALIKAAFPLVPEELVNQMLSGMSGFTPSVAAPTAEARAEAVTNFPEDGDDKKVTLRNSQYQLFPVGEAENLKENWPDIWRKGGNIKGNEQFAKLAPLAKRGGVPDGEAEENAIRLREAWVARHRGDFQLAGVVAQIKWLAVGDRGLDHMRAVIREAKEKSEDRSTRRMRMTERVRAYAEDGLTGEQIKALVELVEELLDKELPRETVEALIKAAFPKIAPALVSAMLDGLEGFTPAPEEPEEPEVEESMRPVRLQTTEQRRAYWDRAQQKLDAEEKKYKAMATAQFTRERKKVTSAIASAKTVKQAIANVTKLYKADGAFREDWADSFTPLITKTYESGAVDVAGKKSSISAALNDRQVRQDEFEDLTGVLSAKELKAAALKAIDRRAQRLSKYVGDTSVKEVTAAIRAGDRAGLSVNEISRLVGRAIYGEDRIDARTNAIARTESAGAMSEGSWDQAQAEGELFRSKTWLSFEDQETRDTHRALNDVTVAMNEPFVTFTGESLQYPLDPSADAAEVINCRCVLAYSDEPV